MTSQTRRNSAIDPLRILLALTVIALHSGFPEAAPPLLKQVLFNGLYRLAVPVFALISWYFFLSAMRGGRSGPYLRRILALYLLRPKAQIKVRARFGMADTVRSEALKEYYRQMERALREELTKAQ